MAWVQWMVKMRTLLQGDAECRWREVGQLGQIMPEMGLVKISPIQSQIQKPLLWLQSQLAYYLLQTGNAGKMFGRLPIERQKTLIQIASAPACRCGQRLNAGIGLVIQAVEQGIQRVAVPLVLLAQ